jgi:hypothetical protein
MSHPLDTRPERHQDLPALTPRRRGRRRNGDDLAKQGAGLIEGLQRYRDDVKRASAMLQVAQPDLTASESLPAAEAKTRRLFWPFVLAVWMSALLWLSVAAAITLLV